MERFSNIPGQQIFQEDLISSKNISKMSSLVRVKSILKYLLYGTLLKIKQTVNLRKGVFISFEGGEELEKLQIDLLKKIL